MNINQSLYAPIIDSKITIVNIQFVSSAYELDGTGKGYAYKCDIPDIAANDYVVVEAKGMYGVAVVSDVNQPIPSDDREYKWVVGRIDMDTHRKRKKVEDALINQLEMRRVDSVRAQMRAALGIMPDAVNVLSDNTCNTDIADTVLDEVDVCPNCGCNAFGYNGKDYMRRCVICNALHVDDLATSKGKSGKSGNSGGY